jgi:hypothetical protein
MMLLPEDPTPVALSGTRKAPRRDYQGPGCAASQAMGWSYIG